MKVLVTGGCGFIGYHLVSRLVKKGNLVTVVDDLSIKNPKFVPEANYRILPLSKIEKVYDSFDVIYHLAAISSISDSFKRPIKTIETNITGTAILLEKAAEEGSKFIFASTCAVYSLDKSYYSSTKSYGEELCRQANVELTVFRFCNVYGPGDNKGLISMLWNDHLEIFGSGENRRNYVHVEDVVDALVSKNRRDIFEVCSEDVFSVNELVKKTGISVEFTDMQPGHDYSIEITKSNLRNWAPKHKLVDYIEEMNAKRLEEQIPF